jgi:D-arabinose 1-dehydrogenase-like Zn-dependent alcohol dehydrogenase
MALWKCGLERTFRAANSVGKAAVSDRNVLSMDRLGTGQRVGIGGLGHMGIKLDHGLGAHVVAFTTSDSKRQDALKLAADEVVVSRNPSEMALRGSSLNLIVNTVAVSHGYNWRKTGKTEERQKTGSGAI